ncbi:MAG: hypothetical protein LBK27_05945 [Treponema sp.]|jgi:outer membrane protein assembly factor BamD (BamD/ComL family)|nr:hypothetical protein [Treponema sp.]
MNVFFKRYAAVFITGSALLVSACLSEPREIPVDLSPAEMIQRAQEASDKNRYKTAQRYYETIRERHATNMDLVCMAEYEIAFLYYKRNKYDEAKAGFNALLELYNDPDAELMPQQFKKLARKVLDRIEEKENSVPLFGKNW